MRASQTVIRRERGQGFVEFALILPILMMVIMGIFDFGRVLFVYAMASNALRDAARLAEVIGYSSDLTPPYTDCNRIINTARNVFFERPTVTVKYERLRGRSILDCADDADGYIATEDLENGDMLQIESTATVSLFTPFVSNLVPQITFKFWAQRTIVKGIPLGSGPGEDVTDSGYDGMCDLWEDFWFGDHDGIIESEDLLQNGVSDPDNDGCSNGCEEAFFTCPATLPIPPAPLSYSAGPPPNMLIPVPSHDLVGTHGRDSDGDGLLDGEEVYIYGTNPLLVDTDGDTLSDYDEVFGTLGPAGSPDAGVEFITDPTDPDTDHDGLADNEEILGITVGGTTYYTNPRDDDTDDDTIIDGDELMGVTVGVVNPSTYHYPTDPRDTDTDDDDLTDSQEILQIGTDPIDADTDNDGLEDGEEFNGIVISATLTYFPLPLDDDSDDDGLLDGEEINGLNPSDPRIVNLATYNYPTDPRDPDTDGDTWSDGDEVFLYGTDPLDTALDTDSDGLPDNWEINFFGDLSQGANDDPDGDGCTNICEFENGLYPAALASDPGRDPTDYDGDGLTDGNEVNGVTVSIEGSAFTASTHPRLVDSDGDGLDDGAEVDGVAPSSESATTSCTAIIPTHPALADSDGDGYSDRQEIIGVTSTFYGRTYCLNPVLADTDSDGLTDFNEINVTRTDPLVDDTDMDGLLDGDEATYMTLPLVPDTDSDGLLDGEEVTLAAGSACPDPADSDSDDDGWLDGEEGPNLTDLCLFDSPVTISISDATLVEPDSGTANMAFEVTFSEPNRVPIVLSFETVAGSDTTDAQADIDFVTTNGSTSVDFTGAPDGQPFTTMINVPILSDVLDEETETFVFRLTSAVPGTITDGEATGTIIDADIAPTVTIGNVTVSEAGGTATLSVLLSKPSGLTVTVNYATADGTATAGEDYTAKTGSVVFEPGEISQTIEVDILDNSEPELDEQFQVNITSAENATPAGNGRVTIRDDDAGIIIDDTFVSEGNGVTLNATFTVRLTNPSSSDITVSYATSNGTALAGSDYTATSNTLTIVAGQTQGTITVPILSDTISDSGETFNVTLSNAIGGVILDATAVGTIFDPPQISIVGTQTDGSAVVEPITGTRMMQFTVRLSGVTDKAISVQYATVTVPGGAQPDGTGNDDFDHLVPNPSTVTFSPSSSTSQTLQTWTFNVTINADSKNESAEYFRVVVSLVSPYTTYAIITDSMAEGKICDWDAGSCSLP